MLPVTKWLALYKHRRRAKDERRAPAINPSGFRIRRENEEVPYKRKGQWSAGNVMGPGFTELVGAAAGRVCLLRAPRTTLGNTPALRVNVSRAQHSLPFPFGR